MSGFEMNVEFDAEWGMVVQGLGESPPLVYDILKRSVARFGTDAVKVAKDQLNAMVYDAPLPPSADKVWSGDYLDRSRIGRTLEAIKYRPGALTSEAYVDPGDYPSYFYAMALEFGMTHGANQFGSYSIHTYYPRPFWRNTLSIMEREVEADGIMLDELMSGLERLF